ncbi:hypothetical protein B5S28_g2511 [[Candida] boidinii]|uniref:Unnamed protein product n=1 Tax=Candida boidinii TaxID=5477 RepID=A0ACB5TL17_CANBO|nr:hypothetical protein B5S28_g2511 [[Candida] boidinii]OWB78199.1 hypothetical protein B5S32_g2387 [[Candida] boidinii]GME90213.1 unnamed protein product [[Candida] boidinii]
MTAGRLPSIGTFKNDYSPFTIKNNKDKDEDRDTTLELEEEQDAKNENEEVSTPSSISASSVSSLKLNTQQMIKDSKLNSEGNIKFDPVQHLSYRNRIILKEIDKKSLNLGLKIEDYENFEIVNNSCFPLFNRNCIEIMKDEFNKYICNLKKNNKKKYNKFSFVSEDLKESKRNLPFCYQAWNNKHTINAISAIAGIDLKICSDFEIAHFSKNTTNKKSTTKAASASASASAASIATKISTTSSSSIYKSGNKFTHSTNNSNNKQNYNNHFKNYNNNNIPTDQVDYLISREKSIAYPYVCIVKLISNEDDESPEGYGIILQGRININIACKQVIEMNKSMKAIGNYNIVMMATFQPKNLINYEDMKFLSSSYYTGYSSAQKLLTDGNNINGGIKKLNLSKKRSNSLDSGSFRKKLKRDLFMGRANGNEENDDKEEDDDEEEEEEDDEEEVEDYKTVEKYVNWLKDYYSRPNSKRRKKISSRRNRRNSDSSATPGSTVMIESPVLEGKS